MDLDFIKKQAEQGKVWAIERLKQVDSDKPKPKSQKLNIINDNNMVDDNKVIQKEKGRIISLRMPEDLLNKLYQQRFVKCRTLSSMIKEAIADWVYWQDKLNELKLKELREKLS